MTNNFGLSDADWLLLYLLLAVFGVVGVGVVGGADVMLLTFVGVANTEY